MAGLEHMKIALRVLICGLLLVALLGLSVSCIHFVPREEESSSTQGDTATETVDSSSDTSESSSTTADGDIPNVPEDNYTKFY